ncbi:MAG: hypothetical protein ACRDJF_01620 [Actinomycetota bacterium]
MTAEGRGTPRIYELIENTPKTGKTPTVWAFPQVIEWLKVAGQPVPGPWPPHQEPRPDPAAESIPIAVPERQARPRPAAPPAPTKAEPEEEKGSGGRYLR